MRFEEESFWNFLCPQLAKRFLYYAPPPPLSPSPSSGNTFMGLELQFYLELHQMLVSILFNTSASPSPSPSFIVSKSGSTIYKSRAVHYSQRFRLALCSFSRFLKFAASFQTMCFLIIYQGPRSKICFSESLSVIQSTVEPLQLSHARFIQNVTLIKKLWCLVFLSIIMDIHHYVSLLSLSVGTSASVSRSVSFPVLTSESSSVSPSISASLSCECFFPAFFVLLRSIYLMLNCGRIKVCGKSCRIVA